MKTWFSALLEKLSNMQKKLHLLKQKLTHNVCNELLIYKKIVK